ncbi:MAG: hypothetical protein K6E19_00365 [Lachnospiraceae bacterium]|nr:hypothetical protein [Lachnospiraceae bacterium]
MGLTEIILLVIGGLFFAISFFLPDGTKKEKTEISQDEIKALVDKEIQDAKSRIEDMVDETVNYSIEKTERALEKLTNEKIMAVDEYSQTVLKKINDNHQEAVFLYDMLNDKDEKLKQAVADEAKEKEEAKPEVIRQETPKPVEIEAVQAAPEPVKTPEFIPFVPKHYEVRDGEAVLTSEGSHPIEATEPEPEKSEPEKPARKTSKPAGNRKRKTVEKPLGADEGGLDEVISERSDYDGRKNSNDLIIRLHNEGKTNMQIAKELGLGVGEVKLVIDLFVSKKGK